MSKPTLNSIIQMDPMAPLAPMLDNVSVKINLKDNLVIVAKMDSTGFLTVNLANVIKMVAYTIFVIRSLTISP